MSSPVPTESFTSVSSESRLDILRQLSFLLTGGLQIAPAVEALQMGREGNELRFLQQTYDLLVSGATLSATLHRMGYSRSIVALVKTGEESGRLHSSLDMCIQWANRDQEVRRKIKSALTYPAIVLVASIIMAFILFRLLVPPFKEILESMQADIPLYSQIVFQIADLSDSFLFYVLLAAIAIQGLYWTRAFLKDEEKRRALGDMVMAIPVVGEVIKLSVQIQFCYAMNALVSTGVDLVKAVHYSSQATNNPSFESWGSEAKSRIQSGLSLAECVQESDLFSSLTYALIAVGEEVGRLDTAFVNSGRLLSEELDCRLESLTALVEPVLLLFSGLTVGLILASTFIPMYQSISQI